MKHPFKQLLFVYSLFYIYIFYHLSFYNRCWLLVFTVTKVNVMKYLYNYTHTFITQCLQYSILDILHKIDNNNHIDIDIFYLIYKNKNDTKKINSIFENYPNIKYTFTTPIYLILDK